MGLVFWIFMLVNNLVMPVMLIVFGYLFQKHPPKEIQSVYGYRTKMSMQNRDTWNYAHSYFGKLWLRAGWLLLPFTFLGMLSVMGRNDTVVGVIGGAVITAQILVMLLPVLWTERELRKKFEPDGRRKQEALK